MFFGRLFGSHLDQIVGIGLPTTNPDQETITKTTASVAGIVQPGTVVILKNTQTLEDIIAILNTGGMVQVGVRNPHFSNSRTLETLKDYPVTYSVDSHLTYSPKPLKLELAERLS